MTAWSARAACLGQNPDRWFPTLDDSDNHGRQAKAICAGCPVRLECLVDALRRNEDSGIWGGAGEDVRRRLARMLVLADHDPTVLPDGCGCRWCVDVRDHFARLDGEQVRVVNRNGDGARCGLRITYNRGCRCPACELAVQLYGQEQKFDQRSSA